MNTEDITIVPILTTSAGSCLTAQNWHETGVREVSYSLMALLFKPGRDYLTTLADWSKYSGWEGQWVLNASMPTLPGEGQYILRSPFDGTVLLCSMEDIVDIVCYLKPQQVILPQGFDVANETWRLLSETTALFMPVQDWERGSHHPIHGLYYVSEQPQNVADLVIKHQTLYPELECYIQSDSISSLAPLRDVAPKRSIFLESDGPAKDAYMGMVYSRDDSTAFFRIMDLKDTCYSMQFDCIDTTCHCPTCEQHLSQAYLHYLFEHTPLLCQRLLIQHNAYLLNHSIYTARVTI